MMTHEVTYKPISSRLISVVASMRGKHIGTTPSALSPFYQKLETNLTSYDPKLPERGFIGTKLHMGHREWPNIRKYGDK